MTSGGKNSRFKLRCKRWLDECQMAISGILLASRRASFWTGFLIMFVIFGTLMNLLAAGIGVFSTLAAVDWTHKLEILGAAFLANFGVGRGFIDWILSFIIVVLQSTLIGLIVFVWHGKRRDRSATARELQNANNVQDAGLAAGLAVLGSGCPTCGTSLLAPVVSSVASSGGYLLAGVLSYGLTIAAVILVLFALKRIGKDAYVMILATNFATKQTKKSTGGKHAQ